MPQKAKRNAFAATREQHDEMDPSTISESVLLPCRNVLIGSMAMPKQTRIFFVFHLFEMRLSISQSQTSKARLKIKQDTPCSVRSTMRAWLEICSTYIHMYVCMYVHMYCMLAGMPEQPAL